MKRSGQLARATLRRSTPLAQVGARAEREAIAIARFRRGVLARCRGYCERCGCYDARLEAHHIVPRSRGAGWKHLHHPEVNGAGLCSGERGCHQLVHLHEVSDWARWLRRAPPIAR